MKTRITKARLRARLEKLLAECQQQSDAVYNEGHWTPDCTEAWDVDRVRIALDQLQTRTVLQFRKWCGAPHYTIDHEILRCLDS